MNPKSMHVLGIIPARYASTRLPGKPLIDIGGKPMVQRVYETAAKVLDHVYVATDDTRIIQVVKTFGGKAVMTSPTCPTGSDRCIEAIPLIEKETHQTFDMILNIQGDEPFLHPEMLTQLIDCFQDATTTIATLANPILHSADIFNQVEAKIVLDQQQYALYFSRSPIPYVMHKEKSQWLTEYPFYKHIGLYAFQKDVLRALQALPPSPLAQAESLEQNGWLAHGYRIKVAITSHESIPVDTQEDLERIKALPLD